MATLAEMLRQTGYAKDGQLQAPAPTQPNLSTMSADYIRQLPQKFNENQAEQMALLARAFPDDTLKNADTKAMAEMAMQTPFNALTAFHGTPHKILGKFDISKVGTGEGAQSYGHGMYFAQAKPVAETYKRAGSEMNVSYAKPLQELGINPDVAKRSMDFDENPVNQGLGRIVKGLRTTALDYPDVPVNKSLVKEHFDEYIRLLEDKYPKDAAQKKALQDLVAKEGYPDIGFGGNLYKVDIPDEHIPNMLDWDKPLKDQPIALKAIRSAIKDDKLVKSFDEGVEKGMSGETAYKGWVNFNWVGENGMPTYKTDAQASAKLNELGIKGIRYLDRGSREGEKGTSNFVVFDPSTVKILEENGIPTRKELIQQQIDKIE